MNHDFKHFLRHGGTGEYVFHEAGGRVRGRSLSRKSQFPGYEGLQQAFRLRLEAVAAENARMLLSALTSPDSVPRYSEADLLPASGIIDDALQHWESRLDEI